MPQSQVESQTLACDLTNASHGAQERKCGHLCILHNSSHQFKDKPKAVTLELLDGTRSQSVSEQKGRAAPPQPVKMQPVSVETSGASNYQKICESQRAWRSVLTTGSTSGPPIQAQPTRSPRDRLREQSLADHTTHLAFAPAWTTIPSRPCTLHSLNKPLSATTNVLVGITGRPSSLFPK